MKILQPFMNHLSIDNSQKLNLRSNCVSGCKIQIANKIPNCFSLYKDKFTSCLCVKSVSYLYDKVTETLKNVKGPEA